MGTTAKRTAIMAATVATACAATVAASPGALAATGDSNKQPTVRKMSATVWKLHHNAAVSTYIKSMDQTITTTGTQDATFNLTSRALSANLALKEATAPVKVIGLPLAKSHIAIEPIGPATGTIAMSNNQLTATQKLNIHITSIDPLGLPLNIVGKNCITSTPVTMKLTGKVTGLFDPIKLTGTFDIPKFKNCGISTPIVSKMVSGTGNKVSINLTA